MNDLIENSGYIPAMNRMQIDNVRHFEAIALARPQIDIPTEHLIHAGIYARTIMIPANTVLTGALIKIATILVIQGDVIVHIGDDKVELRGYNIFPASANRKQAFFAKTDTYLTMIFTCGSKNIREAEDMFTDEADMLISRKEDANNKITITGD